MLQSKLVDTYDLGPQPLASQFLCDKHTVTDVLNRPPDRPELLVVCPDTDENSASVGLYIDADILERSSHNADAFFITLEGVSHLTYMLFRAPTRTPVSELELELQAEVDKYMVALAEIHPMTGRGVGLIRSKHLRQRLFQQVAFHDSPTSEQGSRYRFANALALQYTQFLEARYIERADTAGFHRELRRFYRMSQSQKLRQIERPST